MPIKTCIFDMGNVLVYFSHKKMCENIAAVCDYPVEDTANLLLTSGLQFELERGDITEEQFHSAFESKLQKSVNFEDLKHAAADIFWLNDSIVPLVDELKQMGMRLVLLSNTSVTHLRFIQQNYDILSVFDELTTSFDAGALKPESPIYEDALRKSNCSPEDCFYTDDIEKYVLKAREFGINAEVYTDTSATYAALRELGVPLS